MVRVRKQDTITAVHGTLTKLDTATKTVVIKTAKQRMLNIQYNLLITRQFTVPVVERKRRETPFMAQRRYRK
jgi:hypothetical protein